MYGQIVSAALLGLTAVASARPMTTMPMPTSSFLRPTGTANTYRPMGTGSAMGTTGTGNTTSSFKFPLGNGFPNIAKGSAQLSQIEQQAGGTLPNGTPPPGTPPPSGDSQVSLGLIAFNELFEVAFFTELIQNIMTNAPGYTDIPDRAAVLATLKVILAQEELHELNANGAFQKFTGQAIQPCQYQFPVSTFPEAIALASTFTDVVLSTLPDIQTVFAEAGDAALIRGVGSVIGQEGEQNGFYRELLHKNPSQLPFLTGGARDFAFNGILGFVVPGSCPSLGLLKSGVNGGKGLQEFGVLKVLTPPTSLEDTQVKFSFSTVNPASGSSFLVKPSTAGLYVTYINQQNVPISVPISTETANGSDIEFTAQFPGKTNDLNGLTIAAITSTNGPFTSPDDVAAVTLAGPGLIEIN